MLFSSAAYCLQLKLVGLSLVMFDLWQEEVLQAGPTNRVYNDPWGVHSRKVSSTVSRCPSGATCTTKPAFCVD